MQRCCSDLEAWLGDLAADEFDLTASNAEQAGRRRELQAHLCECARCREQLRDLQWVDRLLTASLRDAPVPARLTLPHDAVSARPAARIGWFRPALATATVLLAILVWTLADRQPQQGSVAQSTLDRRGAPAVAPRQSESANDEQQWTDLEVMIEREESAARLAAAAETMADQSAAENYALEALQFVATTFPDTQAGLEAGRRLGSRTNQRKEHHE